MRGEPLDATAREARLASHRAAFADLPPVATLRGRYAAVEVGPRWYRAAFRALLAIGGLRGWVGKEFGPDGRGVNLCRRRGRLVRRSRLEVAGPVLSALDGRPALLLRYRDRSPLRLVRDELREREDGTLLGLTYLALGPLRRVRLPFAIAPVLRAAPAVRTARG